MRKILLKVVIGVIAIPTVTLGALFVTRNIPVVNEKIVTPLAKAVNSIGLPVLVKPKISEETMRKCIGDLKYIYYVQRSCCEGEYPNCETDTIDEWLEKSGCRNPETQELQNIKAVNNQEGFGTKYFILLYSEKEGYNLTWREFLETDLKVTELRRGASEEDIKKCLQLDLEEDIPMNDLSISNSDDGIFSLYQKRTELSDQYQEAMKNGDKEKEKELQQQIEKLENEIKEYENSNNKSAEKNEEQIKKYNQLKEKYDEIDKKYIEAIENNENEKAEELQKEKDNIINEMSNL